MILTTLQQKVLDVWNSGVYRRHLIAVHRRFGKTTVISRLVREELDAGHEVYVLLSSKPAVDEMRRTLGIKRHPSTLTVSYRTPPWEFRGTLFVDDQCDSKILNHLWTYHVGRLLMIGTPYEGGMRLRRKEEQDFWMWVPITQNPDFRPIDIETIQNETTEEYWRREWSLEYPVEEQPLIY
jgi:hypothetical protein